MDLINTPHRRKNILTGEWVLVSPHRTQRPWVGKKSSPDEIKLVSHDPSCYLCPGNERTSGSKNPNYKSIFSFTNDFSALKARPTASVKNGLLEAESESGICKVICYSPNHALTMPLMTLEDIIEVINLWQIEYRELGSDANINHVQIFENKGALMGCSNQHPHGQIWAQQSIPHEVQKKITQQKKYWEANKKSLLGDYLIQELKAKERIIIENQTFTAIAPFWATWPFETMIVPKRKVASIIELTNQEIKDYASMLQALTIKYDNLFNCSFPYSAGIHQAPTNSDDKGHWHMHMSFYPPLLRSAEIKKFMVGYEMFAMPQRDITVEEAALRLRNCSDTHYTKN